MEKIEITTRFSGDGKLIPLEFSLGEKTIGILNIGRQWQTKEGKHILVMDTHHNTYHLYFELADLSWYLIRDLKGSPGKV
ncbi:MAG TPA: hypothetical protein ENG59_02105 [Chloroflexi bacterium]|nr:MAG: hypothetical protein DRI46_07310 [Chloroflexota bacterium]HDD55022.1 hypothetical protein [Chloroflexota bacterium]